MELTPINSSAPLGKTVSPNEDKANSGTPPETSAQAHYRSDVDSSVKALHHTIGSKQGQAASGAHLHDGTTSHKLGGLIFDTTVGQEGKTKPALSISGSRGSNAALTSLIALLKNFVDFNDNTTA